jgi:CRISPR-associated protein Csn2
MKLFWGGCDLEIELKEGDLAGICIENTFMFRRFTESLWNQANGIESEIFLTQGEKPIRLNKEGCVIFTPYSVDVNERKIINRVYGEMQEIADMNFYTQQSGINSAVVSLLDEIGTHLSYPLDYSLNLDFQQLLKAYGVKLEMKDTELIERVVNYIRLSHQVLGTIIFVFVHFRDYFTQEELFRLKEMIQYEQITFLMIESSVNLEEATNEKWWIVDKDLCIIDI